MKKVFYTLILASLFCLPAKSQDVFQCGPGTTIVVNSLVSDETMPPGCTFSYDITIITTVPGVYRIKALNETFFEENLTAGTHNFVGVGSTVIPCIVIFSQLDELDVITPSGSCELDLPTILPVRLTAFDAFEENGLALLRWSTASEQNNEGFRIEHTQNGDDWETMGFVDGVGTTNEPQNYSFEIEDLTDGDHYFRLKQMDFDGRFSYSPVANLYLQNPANVLKVYPNPIKRGQTLNIRGTYERAEIYNAAGQRILSLPSNSTTVQSPQFLDLPAGFYHIMIQRQGQVIKRRLIVQ